MVRTAQPGRIAPRDRVGAPEIVDPQAAKVRQTGRTFAVQAFPIAAKTLMVRPEFAIGQGE
jgi:hypothetical protein